MLAEAGGSSSRRPFDTVAALALAGGKRRRSKDGTSYRNDAQVEALATLAQAGMDMRRLNPQRTGSFGNTASASRRQLSSLAQVQLEIETIRIGLVNRNRNDVASPRLNEDASHTKNYSFLWQRTEISNTLKSNDGSLEKFRYDRHTWTDEILTLLKEALRSDCNIVSFGEFDYPIDLSKDEKAAFEKNVQQEVNKVDRGVFAVIGTAHVLESARTDEWTGPVAQNVAKVVISDNLLEGKQKAIRDVKKRTPASKAGELLTGLHGIDMEVFNTPLGKLAVVICSDAYDPSIVLEFFARSTSGDSKRDIIIIPSYNTSIKLTYMCQLLSLVSESVVILVDACSFCSNNTVFDKSDAWIYGISVSALSEGELARHGVCRWVETKAVENSSIKILEVSLPKLRDFITYMGKLDPMPMFSKVRTLLARP